jgi:phosphatidylglycerophosphate synthase
MMSAPAVPAPLERVPNALTVLRLLLIPVFAVLLIPADEGYSWPAAIVFGVAGITDQVDGWLARRWHVESAFGKVADPLADRLMIDAAVIILELATWVLYASLVFVMVTHKGTEWPLWCFWIGLALALAAGAQYVYSVMRGTSA